MLARGVRLDESVPGAGLEVAGGFALMFLEFLKHLRKPAEKEES